MVQMADHKIPVAKIDKAMQKGDGIAAPRKGDKVAMFRWKISDQSRPDVHAAYRIPANVEQTASSARPALCTAE